MSERKEPFQAQATRSFGDYIQGAWYAIDPEDGQLMSLLGVGYFSTEGNENLTHQHFEYQAGEVVTPVDSGIHADMTTQEHVNPDEGYQPNYDNVDVPEKMTGAQRATTAENEENEAANGQVGTESGNDSTDGKQRRTATRQSRNARDN